MNVKTLIEELQKLEDQELGVYVPGIEADYEEVAEVTIRLMQMEDSPDGVYDRCVVLDR